MELPPDFASEIAHTLYSVTRREKPLKLTDNGEIYRELLRAALEQLHATRTENARLNERVIHLHKVIRGEVA